MNLLKTPPPKWLKIALIWIGIVIGAQVLVGVFATSAAVGYAYRYRDQAYPGVFVANIRLDGKTRAEATAAVQERVDQAIQDGWRFRVGDLPVTVPVTVLATSDPDLSRDNLRYDVSAAVDNAFKLGRSGNFWTDAVTQIRLRVSPIRLNVPSEIATEQIRTSLETQLHDVLVAPEDAELVVTVPTGSDEPTVGIKPERIGVAADLTDALKQAEDQAKEINFSTITIPTHQTLPEKTSLKLQPLVSEVTNWMAHAPFKISAEGQTWNISKATLAGWLGAVTTTDGGIRLDFDAKRVDTTLTDMIRDVLIEPIDGKLTLENGALKDFVAPQEGTRLNTPVTIDEIKNGWAHNSSTIPLAIDHVTPLLQGTDAEQLGIREVLGVGRSEYAGSPSNRRRNIALGAKKLNGIILAPGEEFSLLKTLGDINGANGWLPELVIKGDKTTPEFGGGLCQIGTTIFRTALASGMPITERRNHSYRVRYYEPAGTDATIYDPAPDFRFQNDTAHSILITTRVLNERLAFTIWGTNDGRLIHQTYPRIYNIVAPPPKKTIETLDLPEGKTKCTEVAHAGADASFDYTVTYPNAEVKKVTFNSHYRPWGAVCLVGVKALTVPVDASVDQTGINNPN